MTTNEKEVEPKYSDFYYCLRKWMHYNGYTPQNLEEVYWALLAFVQFLESVEATKPPEERTWWKIDG